MYKSILVSCVMAALAGSAFAHASLEQKVAKAGATTKITLRVPHGCDGAATDTVRISLPDGFYAAQPMPKAGWTLETETGAYAKPYDNHGTEMAEGLREVVWSGGHLADAWYDEFIVRGVVGADVAPGSVLYFPSVQNCGSGSVDWTDTSGSHDVPNPAPSLKIVAADAGHGHSSGHDHGHGNGHGNGHDMAKPAAITLGDITITNPFSRATLPNAPVGGGFMTITNSGSSDDRLIAVETSVAMKAEIHEMSMTDQVMKMREVTEGLVIPAGDTIELKPGGFHLMFMKLQEPLIKGETLHVTLTFERAGTVDVPLSIGAPNAKAADAPMNHDSH